MNIIADIFAAFIVSFSVAAFPALFSLKSRSAKAKSTKNDELYIDYSQFIFGFIYLVGIALMALGLLIYFYDDAAGLSITLILFGLAFCFFTAFLQLADTTVRWTEEYLCGPKSGYSIKKEKLLWKDISGIKHNANHTLHVHDKAGKKVVWSVYYSGWHQIIEELRRQRPNVDTSNFD